MTDPVQYIVYDLSISDLEMRRQRAVVYLSARKLSDALGLPPNRVPDYVKPEEKKRFFSEKLKKEFAIRLAKKKQRIAIPEKINHRIIRRKTKKS